jgi:hypothetical protein
MISSIGSPDPIVMRKLLDYLARRKSERLQEAKSHKSAARKNARRRQAVRA